MLQELKRQIITSIKMNKNLEQDLDMMDVKIGLLVKNRITLQDVLMQHKKLKKYKEDIEINATNQIKQLSKENHVKMELYQNLFYLLQTNPSYLAKLLFALPTTNSSKFIESVVLQLFNYGANSREEYLLLKLFTAALQQEIDALLKVDKMSDIITGTPLVIKVIVSLYRKHRGENILRNLLHSTIKEFLECENLKLCLNPSDIYKSWINKLESDTGKSSGLPYDVTNQKALEYDEVRKQLEENIKTVKYHTGKFLHLILNSMDKLPFGLRYVAKVLRNSLKVKFPQATEREILKIIGNLVYYRFINSAICSPDAYDIIDAKVGNAILDTDQRKNLACIAKHLQLISMSKGYGDSENAHLSCLNPFIKESHELIRNYFNEVCHVNEAEEYFGIDEYTDSSMLTKPLVYMTVQEICDTHKILIKYLDKIAPESNDPLREIFSLLTHEPNLDSLTENLCSKINVNSHTPSDTITRNNFSKNTQICLTLTNRYTPNGGDEKSEGNNLFVRTKRFIVEIIHCQPGEDLREILKTPATLEQEVFHEELLKKREMTILMNVDPQRLSKPNYTSLESMKKEVRKNLIELENLKLIPTNTNNNSYQLIISKISQDIRNQRKHRQKRQKELIHLQEVHTVLDKKHNLLKEQVTFYNEYVKACLDSFNSKKCRSKNPFKRNKEEKLMGSIKYSAAKLHDKGVILEIENLQPNQFKNVLFEISTTDEPGVFEVSAKFMGVTMEKVDLVFQDLLQMQYEGASIMKMFDRAKINVNLLIFLLNKKFYGK
jgi:Ras GTPase-activating-like protein IQGAP1